MGFFSKKDKDDGIRVIRSTRPGECGGTDATLDERAPKVIASDEITCFEATSALNGDLSRLRDGKLEVEPFGYLSAFALPACGGSFLLLETSGGFRRREERRLSFALIGENIFPALAALVRECDLAAQNGYHSTTHGLPENFGGSVRIEYASGEKISFSDNQTPILRFETAVKIRSFFEEALKKEKIALPDVSALRAIRYDEERKDGGYTRALLTLTDDGCAVNAKESRYDSPTVYKSEKPVDKETVDAIKKNIEDNALFARQYFPKSRYSYSGDKKMTFLFDGGGEITVRSDVECPDQIRNGFFKIELEMTTKH